MAFSISSSDIATIVEVMALITADNDVADHVRTDYTPHAGATPVMAIVGDDAHSAFVEAVDALTNPAPVRAAMASGPETDSLGMRTDAYNGLTID